MIYKWKFQELYPVDPQVAGEELDRIFREKGGLHPAEIVNESRDESAPLHPCFEWNDETAAEKYRETQARDLVRAIVTIPEAGASRSEVRAFVHVQNTYQPMAVVISDADKMADLLNSALKELSAFRCKYSHLEELATVFDAIDSLTA